MVGCNEKLIKHNQYCNKHALQLLPQLKHFIEKSLTPLEREQ
jgi:hypothetical protein